MIEKEHFVTLKDLEINKEEILKEVKDEINKLFVRLENSNPQPDRKKLREDDRLFNYMEREISKNISSTFKTQLTLLNRFKNYLSEKGIKALFSNMDYKAIYNYKLWLECKKLGYETCKSSLDIIIRLLSILSANPNLDYEIDHRIRDLKIDIALRKVRRREDREVKTYPLTSEQINSFLIYQPDNNLKEETRRYIEITQKMFLLQVMTGIRYSDFIQLINPENVISIENKKIIRFLDAKEGNNKRNLTYVNVIVTPEIEVPLEYFYRHPEDLLSAQTYTNYLKRISREISYFKVKKRFIDSNGEEKTKYLHDMLTPHNLRHTFITNMYNKGYSESEIINFTGHSSTDVLKSTYIHKNDNAEISKVIKLSSKY